MSGAGFEHHPEDSPSPNHRRLFDQPPLPDSAFPHYSLNSTSEEILDVEMEDSGGGGNGHQGVELKFDPEAQTATAPSGNDLLREPQEGQGQSLFSRITRKFSWTLGRISRTTSPDGSSASEGLPLPSAANRVLQFLSPEQQTGTLSTFMGVFVQCIMGTFGIIIFLRMGWIAGQAGLYHSLFLFLLSYAVILLSMLSVAAIATNGKMQGGGFYFLISRTLGPEFGGSIGIIFYSVSLAGTAFYLLGLSEALKVTFALPDTRWMTFLYCICGLAFTTVLGFTSPKLFARLSFVVFLLLIGCIFFAWIGFLTGSPGKVPGFTGPSLDTLRSNLWPAAWSVTNNGTDTTASSSNSTSGSPGSVEIPEYSFQRLFGLVFPATTGIVAGVNMSGDLATPERSIPKGTLWAVITAFLTYVSLVITMLWTVESSTLIQDKYIMLSVSPASGVIAFGIFVAILSSALSCLATGARVLQAIAADKLIPFLRPFGALDPNTKEPRRATMLTSFLTIFLLLIPALDYIASVITTFYLLAFLFTNFACFVLSMLSAPNFRPLFKYYHWGTALAGAILCTAVMFFVDPAAAGISITIEVVAFFYIHFQSPVVSWGYISQALMFQQVRKYLLLLDIRKLQHVKYWRPQVLHMVANPRSCLPLIHFVNKLQQGGLYITGTVLPGEWKEHIEQSEQLSHSWLKLVDQTKIEAFPEVVISPTIRLGCQTLLMTAGISGMKPNTVIMGFYDMYLAPQSSTRVSSDVAEALSDFPELRESSGDNRFPCEEYVATLGDILLSGKHLILARHFEKLVDPHHPLRREDIDPLGEDLLTSSSPFFEKWAPMIYRSSWFQRMKMYYNNQLNYIDVWPLAQLSKEEDSNTTSTFSITLLLGYILANSKIWSRLRLRVMSFVEDESEIKPEEKRIQRLLQTTRIEPHEIRVFALENVGLTTYKAKQELLAIPNDPYIYQKVSDLDRARIINELLQQQSNSAAAIFISIPNPPLQSESTEYIEQLDTLSASLPPTLMCRGTSNVITTEL